MALAKIRDVKKEALDLLGHGPFKEPWITFVGYLLIAGLLAGAASGTVAGAILIPPPLRYGAVRIFELRRRNEKFTLDNIFDGFREKFGTSILLSFLEGLFIFLWSLLLIIPGIIKYYSYCMSFYLLQGNKDYQWVQAHNESKRLMRNHKREVFKLDLSFIGWYLLGLLCLGVGVLFVHPYHAMCRTILFNKIKESDEIL